MIRRLALRRPRPTAAAATLRRRLLLGATALLLLLGGCGLGFYLAFPGEALRHYLQQEARRRWQLELQIGRLAPRLPVGLRAEELALPLAGVTLPVERLDVAPLWSSLLGGNPGTAFTARLLGGELHGSLRRRGELSLDGRALAVTLPLPRTSGLVLHGELREASFGGALPPRPEGESRLQLTLENCALTGLKTVGLGNDRLELGRLVLAAAGRGNALAVQRLSLDGGALSASGEGTLLLAAQPAQTRLNLALALRPGAQLDPLLTDLLALVAAPSADGVYRLRLGGLLTAPALQK